MTHFFKSGFVVPLLGQVLCFPSVSIAVNLDVRVSRIDSVKRLERLAILVSELVHRDNV